MQSRVTKPPNKVRCRVRFNKIPEKVPVKVCEALVQSQVSFRRRFRRRFWSGEGSGSFGAEPGQVWEALVQSQVRFNRICGHLTHGNRAEVFPALGFSGFRKVCENKTLRLLGITEAYFCFFFRFFLVILRISFFVVNLLFRLFPNSKSLLWGL